MLDHLLGRPSTTLKRIQTLLIIVLGCNFIVNGKTKQLPMFIQKLNKTSSKSPWRIALSSWLIYYVFQNLFLLLGLNAPEPLTKNTYKRNYYRATWLLTALDAGFFTAMSFKPSFLKHTFSILFSMYYLLFTDAAEEKVRRYHKTLSVEVMRNSWDKVSHNPFLRTLSYLIQPKMSIRDILTVDRPEYHKELPPVEIYRYYYKPKETYADNDTILLQIHGGGFVAMNPVCHEDPLCVYAQKTGLPIISINYKKAPEYPFPWPIEECFDFYVDLVESKGKNVGLKGEKDLNIILICDSAGGSIACGVMFKIINHNQQLKSGVSTSYLQVPQVSSSHLQTITSCPLTTPIQLPISMILIYPVLDFEIGCWMSPSQLSLIRAESSTSLFRTGSLDKIWQTKDHLHHAKPLSIEDDLTKKQSLWRKLLGMKPVQQQSIAERSGAVFDRKAWDSARVAMTSRMSHFNDRVITPDLMRAMGILYIGPYHSPDFETDYFISPIVAPADILAHFPKMYMMCGEKDPLVDDTILFAGRVRQAKQQYRQQHPMETDMPTGNEDVRVKFLEGISHAFLQMMPFLPEGQQAARTIADWINEIASTVRDDVLSGSESDHIAEIITSEKDMFRRRKKQLVTNLF